MEIKKIVEGMTATEVAQVIDDNFKAAEKDKANKTDVNASIAKLTETVETNKTETDAKIDSNKEETDGKLSELGSEVENIHYKNTISNYEDGEYSAFDDSIWIPLFEFNSGVVRQVIIRDLQREGVKIYLYVLEKIEEDKFRLISSHEYLAAKEIDVNIVIKKGQFIGVKSLRSNNLNNHGFIKNDTGCDFYFTNSIGGIGSDFNASLFGKLIYNIEFVIVEDSLNGEVVNLSGKFQKGKLELSIFKNNSDKPINTEIEVVGSSTAKEYSVNNYDKELEYSYFDDSAWFFALPFSKGNLTKLKFNKRGITGTIKLFLATMNGDSFVIERIIDIIVDRDLVVLAEPLRLNNNQIIGISAYKSDGLSIHGFAENPNGSYVYYADLTNSNEGDIITPTLFGKRLDYTVEFIFENEYNYKLSGTWESHGDSITWQDGKPYVQWNTKNKIAVGYQTLLCRMSELKCDNQGQSGWSMSGEVNRGWKLITSRDMSNVDYVTIAYGTNDFSLDKPLGEIGSIYDTNLDTNTFIGAYKTSLNHIIQSNPKCKIMLITPLQRGSYGGKDIETKNAEGLKLKDYRDAIIELGQLYGLPVYDAYSKSGINPLNMNTLLMDKLHPNDEGYNMWVSDMRKFFF